jgi:hypothetical protein
MSNHYSVGAVLHQHAPVIAIMPSNQSSGAVLSRSARQNVHYFQLGGADRFPFRFRAIAAISTTCCGVYELSRSAQKCVSV